MLPIKHLIARDCQKLRQLLTRCERHCLYLLDFQQKNKEMSKRKLCLLCLLSELMIPVARFMRYIRLCQPSVSLPSSHLSSATCLQHFRSICELKHCQVWQVASGKQQVAERAFKWKLPTPAAQFNFCCCGCLLPAWPFSFNLLGPFLLLVRFSHSFNQLLNIAFGLRCLVLGVWLMAFDFQLLTVTFVFAWQLYRVICFLIQWKVKGSCFSLLPFFIEENLINLPVFRTLPEFHIIFLSFLFFLA